MPTSLKKYFWDADLSKNFSDTDNTEYIISRLLEYGDDGALRWLMKHIARAAIVDVLKKSRGLSPRSALFWGLLFGVGRSQIQCLQKSYQKTRKKHWAY